MIDGKYFFDQLVKSNMRTSHNIQKIATGQGDGYTNRCLLDYPYFKDHYNMIAIDLSEQQALHADPKAVKQINLTGNLARDRNADATIFFVIKEAKVTILDF